MTKQIKFFAPLDFVLGIEEDKKEYEKAGKSFSEMLREFIEEGRKIKKLKREEKETNAKISVGSR